MRYDLEQVICQLFERAEFNDGDYMVLDAFKQLLNTGEVRAAECVNGEWKVHSWVKQGILLGFRMGRLVNVEDADWGFVDKHTYPMRKFTPTDQVRLVPGGSAVRETAYIGKGVVIMPPSYINVGAYIDDNAMIDSHALVGSCAQVGRGVHLSAGSMLGGVLEPINASPVIVEDDVFIGGNCGIYEGVIVKTRAVLAAGVILTNGTPVFDATTGDFLPRTEGKPLTIPAGAVVVSGARQLKSAPNMSVYCPVIIKYRDEKTDKAVRLEDVLRG